MRVFPASLPKAIVASARRTGYAGRMRPIIVLAGLALALAPGMAAGFPRPNRPVATIVSPSWDDEDARDKAGEATAVMRLLDIGPGDVVADIGAGGGYYTMRVAPKVGAKGLVYAQDIVPRYLNALRSRVRKAGLRNVRFVLGRPSDPRLPRAAIDTALLIHMYHEIAEPYALLYRLRASLKPSGRLAIVDLDRATDFHGTPKAVLVCEVRSVGYELVTMTELHPGYLAVFKRGAAPDPASVKACHP